MKTFHVSRRSFVKRCGLLAAATGVPAWFVERSLAATPAPTKPRSPNDRPRIALIGCGGQGTRDAQNAAAGWGDMVAICDVDSARAAAALPKFRAEGKFPPAVYFDFRKLLERDDVDVIVNGTPDHWHTLINIACARAKKDVYAEKPLTLTIDEGRRLVNEVRKSGIILQTGTQQRSSPRFRLACELVRNGRIGKLKTANVWLPAGLRAGPFTPSAPPASLNWDYWLGQAPKVDYVTERCHSKFRFWYDYSGGTMTDWGAHHNDIAYWAIGILAPREVDHCIIADPIAGGFDAFSEYEVRYVYANGIRLNIYTTTDDNPSGGVVRAEGQRNGIRFEGTDGWIWVNRAGIAASDPELLKTPLPENAVRLYESSNHMGNFFDCAASRKPPICDAETGHRSATMCHLGAISMRLRKKLTWDADTEKFVGEHASEANKYLQREMRKPYDYSFVA